MTVLDSSAMLAYLDAEPGGEVVKALVEDTHNVLYAHAINLCEVFYDILQSSPYGAAEEANWVLKI